ncbi:unnamed protein product [Prorocentrum cordatum]|uniref:RanBP2-type domain-containing protein n=1 Tax=Prorocentrum cordatum TaxID=2364126 RepID=A0ABN9Q8J9_9DINO|nr:unnamed protein product [Polarella glacialis]
MDKGFGSGGDVRTPDARIQRALGLNMSAFSFVQREDDAELAKELGHQAKLAAEDKTAEDRSRDWICMRSNAQGEACSSRNFVRNEKCYKCGGLRPSGGVTVRTQKDVNQGKGCRLDGHKYR